MDSGFENLNDALGSDYNVDEELEAIDEKTKNFEEIKNKIANRESGNEIEDKEYLELELKTLISNSQRIMNILEQDIKIGSKPRYHEVYATLAKSVLDGIKELRELNQTIANLKLQKEKLEIRKLQNGIDAKPTQVNFNLSGRELFKMVEAAKKSSELNSVNAEFEIHSESFKDEQKK